MYCTAVCLSVCMSNIFALSKLLNTIMRIYHVIVGRHHLSFLKTKMTMKFPIFPKIRPVPNSNMVMFPLNLQKITITRMLSNGAGWRV